MNLWILIQFENDLFRNKEKMELSTKKSDEHGIRVQTLRRSITYPA